MTNKFRTRCGSSSSQRRSCAVFPLPDEFVPLKRAICYRATLSFLLLARQEGGKAVESGWEDTARVYTANAWRIVRFFFSPSSSSISFQSFVGGFLFVYSLGSIYIFPSTKIQYDGPLAFQNVVLCECVLYVLQFWLTLYGLCRLWTWTAVCVHPLRSVASRRSSSWLDDIFFFFIGKAGTSSQLV